MKTLIIFAIYLYQSEVYFEFILRVDLHIKCYTLIASRIMI
jgi:hypothetical protein